MPKNFKKLISIILVVFTIIVLLIIIWVKFVPTQKISYLTEQDPDSAISQALCNYPVKVTGDSMNPLFKHGETINFNKCFEGEVLQIDNVVVHDAGSVMRIGVIREIVEGESGQYYKISPEGRQGDISDVFPDKIIAIYNQ
ncbi:MAG: hypothetical protein ABID45_03965 [Patescibacteria group bacterium]